MPCRVIKIGDSYGVICGPKQRVLSCQFCRSPHTRLCDFKMPNGKTCDARICGHCTTQIDDDLDLCPKHVGVPRQTGMFNDVPV